jgi:hypothetical protein
MEVVNRYNQYTAIPITEDVLIKVSSFLKDNYNVGRIRHYPSPELLSKLTELGLEIVLLEDEIDEVVYCSLLALPVPTNKGTLYAVSYLCTHRDYRQQGKGRQLIKSIVKLGQGYFLSRHFPGMALYCWYRAINKKSLVQAGFLMEHQKVVPGRIGKAFTVMTVDDSLASITLDYIKDYGEDKVEYFLPKDTVTWLEWYKRIPTKAIMKQGKCYGVFSILPIQGYVGDNPIKVGLLMFYYGPSHNHGAIFQGSEYDIIYGYSKDNKDFRLTYVSQSRFSSTAKHPVDPFLLPLF